MNEPTPTHFPAWPATVIQSSVQGFIRFSWVVRVLVAFIAIQLLFSILTVDVMSTLYSGVLMFAGIKLWTATDAFSSAHQTGRLADLNDGLERMTMYFRINTILIGIMMGLFALMLLLVIFALILGLAL